MKNDMVWTLTKRNIELEKRIEVLESFIEDLKWNIEYKWGLDRMGERSAQMYHFIRGAYER